MDSKSICSARRGSNPLAVVLGAIQKSMNVCSALTDLACPPSMQNAPRPLTNDAAGPLSAGANSQAIAANHGGAAAIPKQINKWRIARRVKSQKS